MNLNPKTLFEGTKAAYAAWPEARPLEWLFGGSSAAMFTGVPRVIVKPVESEWETEDRYVSPSEGLWGFFVWYVSISVRDYPEHIQNTLSLVLSCACAQGSESHQRLFVASASTTETDYSDTDQMIEATVVVRLPMSVRKMQLSTEPSKVEEVEVTDGVPEY